MKADKRIESERIYLRLLKSEDVMQEYVNWLRDNDVMQFLESRTTKYTLKNLKDYVEKISESSDDFLFGIFLKENDEHIGNIKIGGINGIHKFGDLGLFIGKKKLWGQGYGLEAVQLATECAFDEFKMNKLIAGISKKNLGSYKVFMKAGYREVGILKRHACHNGVYVDSIIVEKCRKACEEGTSR